MKFILTHKLIILGAVIGAVAGFAYYSTIGCISGSCAITSQPVNSTLYGALMGGLALSLFQKERKNQD
jgi:phage shock protein E